MNGVTGARLFRVPRKVEAVFWLSGLVTVMVIDPVSTSGFTVCPFDWLGSLADLSFCPGCGLGHAVGFLVRGDLAQSLEAHPLGIPAILLISLHAWRLLSTPQSNPN